jgi:hypothetical protein
VPRLGSSTKLDRGRAMSEATNMSNNKIISAFVSGVEYTIEKLEEIVCFDALAMHKQLAPRRLLYPSVVGYCEHHGGKCSEILSLIFTIEQTLLPESK